MIREMKLSHFLSHRYGDQVIQSIMGRILAIMWSLTGLVLNGILIGSIISSLYVNNQAEDPVLYNTEVKLRSY